MTQLPDFLIIGAMKCGTTTLQAQLAAQPGIFMTTPKEPNFFSDDDVYAQGLDWYMSLYAAAGKEDLKGEASTHYTKLPTYPETMPRMAQALQTPRLVYVIRDPIARAVSHYVHEWTQGVIRDDIETAFATHAPLIEYSRYATQLEPFIEAFGLHNILLTSLEQMTADPDGELKRVADHIGARQPVAWDHALGAQNVSAQRVRKLPMHKLLIANPLARTLRRTLVPKQVRDKVRQARMPDAPSELTAALQQDLRQRFAPDRDKLAAYFPNHPALDACFDWAAACA